MIRSFAIWPKSLYRQILLVVALALLAAQAVNAYLLIAGARSRFDTEAAAMLITRVANQAERLDDRGRGWDEQPAGNRRRKKSNFAMVVGTERLILPQFTANEEQSARANELLGAQSGLSDIKIASGPITALPDDLRGPLLQGSFLARIRAEGDKMPTGALLLSAKTSDGKWINVAALVRPRNRGAVAALLLQTLILYVAVMIPLALVARRIVRPLERLKERVGRVGLVDEAAPLASEGPSDIRDLIDSFNNMQARVSALLSEKDVMLGAIGHDLKTPLAALRVRVESVEDDSERDKMVATISEMATILDDILMLARVGKSGEANQRTDIGALIESVTEEFATSGANIEVAAPEQRVIADIRPVLIRRALRNVIGNALEYGKSAKITVQQIGAKALITIDDNGPGIAADKIEQMFEPFVRAERSRNRETGGSGLGLTIARSILRSHSGDVRLENRAEGGLRVLVELPN